MKGNEFDYFWDNSIEFVNSMSLPILLAKFSFVFLFLSMLFYWFQATFNYNRDTFIGKIPSLTMLLANCTLALMLSVRWVESGHFPLSNLYESLLFLSWSLTSIHFILERAFGNSSESLQGPTFMQDRYSSLTLGAVTSPLALFTNAFATFSLPQSMQKVTVLVPALQSNWLIMHVSVMMVSYAALLSGSLLAIAFLVVNSINERRDLEHLFKARSNDAPLVFYPEGLSNQKSVKKRKLINKKDALKTSKGLFDPLSEGIKPKVARETPLAASFQLCKPEGVRLNKEQELLPSFSATQASYSSKVKDPVSQLAFSSQGLTDLIKAPTLNLEETLDNLSYRSIGLGFALLTIGIFSGAVWANEAWGSYWNWDPKETWAFVTWLVFALYLHTRLSKGWVGRESALVAAFGFLVIWFCYLGVNLFGKGLHSYGWFPTV